MIGGLARRPSTARTARASAATRSPSSASPRASPASSARARTSSSGWRSAASGHRRARAAIDALVAVGLGEHADRQVGLLSAGQRERVAVARALAARPPVILADEPTSRVDVAAALTLAGLFADIAHEHGTTFVCATHDPVLIGFADDEVQLRGRPGRIDGVMATQYRDAAGDRHPLRALRQPAGRRPARRTTGSSARTPT